MQREHAALSEGSPLFLTNALARSFSYSWVPPCRSQTCPTIKESRPVLRQHGNNIKRLNHPELSLQLCQRNCRVPWNLYIRLAVCNNPSATDLGKIEIVGGCVSPSRGPTRSFACTMKPQPSGHAHVLSMYCKILTESAADLRLSSASMRCQSAGETEGVLLGAPRRQPYATNCGCQTRIIISVRICFSSSSVISILEPPLRIDCAMTSFHETPPSAYSFDRADAFISSA